MSSKSENASYNSDNWAGETDLESQVKNWLRRSSLKSSTAVHLCPEHVVCNAVCVRLGKPTSNLHRPSLHTTIKLFKHQLQISNLSIILSKCLAIHSQIDYNPGND